MFYNLLIADSVTLTLIFILSIVVGYVLYSTRRNNIFHRLGIPGPERIPFVGEMFNIMSKGVYLNDMELIQKYGSVVGSYEGGTPSLLVSDLDLLRQILIKDSHIFVNRRTIDNTSGPFEHGLTVLKDEAWKNVRNLVSPTFSSAKLKAMFHLMNEISDRYNQRLLEYADKQEICDCKLLNGQYTLDNIASCLFGIETNSIENDRCEFIDQLKKFFTINFTNLFLLVFLFSPKLASYLGKKGYTYLPSDAITYVSKVVNDVINRRRDRSERRNDFIQMMIDHEDESNNDEQRIRWKKTLNNEEILSQAFVFLVGGYETTSALMSFFFYVMATRSDIQEKIYDEIRHELADEEITFENLHRLTYLDMVIHETLRMYPPFIRFDRVASTDYQLGHYRIPEGSIINIPVYCVHHDPKHWPEPEKFLPERFSPVEKSKRHPMAFLPFGDGPRSCVGMRFALLEAKLALAKALRLVEIQRCENTKVPLELSKMIVFATKHPIEVRLIRRSQ